VYTEEALAKAGGDWGIVAVAPRSTDVVERLDAQDLLFSVVTLSGEGTQARVVGSLAGVRHAPSDPDAVVALLADPAIRVVTLTVTEKGYRLDPATGALRRDEAVVGDLTTDRPPRTIPGLLVRGLLARARAGTGPIAVVSCDNLPDNGRRLGNLVRQALDLVRGADRGWVAQNVTFPSTTVDRIVPATTAETLAQARTALGVVDHVAVGAEPYRQWVIEDAFPGGRPAWDVAGAVLTGDVAPWERLKLRALNGVHSALAYLGALAGCETIADALDLPGMREVLGRFLAEDIATSLVPPPGVTVDEYGESVLERFANPGIRHRTLQVAMDGSQKLPQRVLHTMLDRRAAGAEPRWAALVVAAWMRFVAGRTDDGRPLPLDDPLADPIRTALARRAATPADTVDALFGLRSVFPAEFAEDPVVRRLVADWLAVLTRHGVSGVLR
jgi:fructuronate reductase